MYVLDIIPLDKNKSKVLMQEDFAFPLYKNEIERFHINVGQELKNYESEILPFLKQRAIQSLLYTLKISDKTEYELIKKLTLAHYPKNVIKYAIIYCRKNGYINDKLYLNDYIELNKYTKSKYSITTALLRKGIKKDDIAFALENSNIDEEKQIIEILKKQDLDKSSDKKEYLKLFTMLVRKGYRFDNIKDNIRRMMDSR